MKESILGRPIPRLDAREKVTGVAKYVDDLKLAGLLHARVLRSPYPHARILRLDTSKAEALAGVKAVATGKDFPNFVGLYLVDRQFFATDKVRFFGEPVAAVAGVTEEIAEEALSLIEVEYEPLKGLFSPDEALAPDAPLVHEKLGEYKCVPFLFPKPGTNISNHFKLRKGDTEKGFAEADHIFENTFYVPHMQHVPIETHTAIAQYDATGKLTIWSSTQSPNAVRKLIGVALDMPMSKIRVISPFVGGGFGGKAGVNIEPQVVAVAIKVGGRPVRLTLTREEEFQCSTVRQGLVARLKTGVTKEGKFVAQEAEFLWDAGAYNEYGANVTRTAGYSSSGPYEIPNMKSDSLCIYTNHPVGGPFRGFGMGEIHWAIEQQIDIIAHELGLDPVEIRHLNALKDGSKSATGEVLEDVGLNKCIDEAAEAIGWGEKAGKVPEAMAGRNPEGQPGKVRGKGLACMVKAPAMPPDAGSSAILKFNEDGTINLLTSAAEIGQGAFTALAQIAAEELGVPMDWISVSTPDTDFTPYEWQTVASRITFSSGNAVLAAARDAKRQLMETASQVFGVEPEDVDMADGYAYVKNTPHKRLHVHDIAMGYYRVNIGAVGGPVIGRGKFVPKNLTLLDQETGQGTKPVAQWTFGVQAVEVEVDTETGVVKVLKVAAAYDVGRVINRQTSEGQAQGGIMQGIGSAFWEGLVLENGRARNGNFVDYKIATSVDVPEMELRFVETPLKDGPFGARGFAEHTMVPTAPAIANAVYDAIGVRIKDLPITPEKILKALKENQEPELALKA